MYKDIGVIGIGACGSNIAFEFEELGYNTLIVNTSMEDLKSVKAQYKYHIKKGEGAAKNRNTAKEVFMADIKNTMTTIIGHITEDFVMVCFGTGGGTGSGIAGTISQILSEHGKKVIMVGVIPNEAEESIVACNNSYLCVSEIEDLDVGCVFLLDNSTRKNKFAINKEFAKLFDDFVRMEHASKEGNLDVTEKKTLLSTKGYAALNRISKEKTSTEHIMNSIKSGCNASLENDQTIMYYGFSMCRSGINLTELEKEIGIPLDGFKGYGAMSNILLMVGLSYPFTRMKKIKSKVSSNMQRITENMNARQTKMFDKEDLLGDLLSSKQPKQNKNDGFNIDLLRSLGSSK